MNPSTGRVEEVRLTVSIDTECDHDVHWARSRPLAFESINEGLPNRLQPVFAASGAIPTYLLSVEVMEDDGSVDTLRGLSGPHELGTHLHAAFVEPQKKFQEYAGVSSPDFQSSYAPDVEYQKLATLTRLFRDRFGYAPQSFRAGRYGAGVATMHSLHKLGYKVDSSVTPHKRWVEPNGTVDFRAAPEQPYFPRAGSVVEAGPAAADLLLEVPVTIRRPRFWGRPVWFRPWFASVSEMKQIFRYYLATYSNQRVISINMMFHSMEVIEKASPYPQTRGEVQRFLDDMHTVLQWCAGEGVVFCPLSDLHAACLPAAQEHCRQSHGSSTSA